MPIPHSPFPIAYSPNPQPLNPSSSPLPIAHSPLPIWIVDEAGLLGAKAAIELLQRAKAENARVLLVGDTRQLSAVESGNPFKSLQQAGMTTAFMDQSLRQRTPPLQVAVDLIAKGEIEAGFARLDEAGCFVEVTEEDKIDRIVADYLTLSPSERSKTLILAGTNAERLAIIQGIRRGLKQEGKLGATLKPTKSQKRQNRTSIDITQLKNKGLTVVQMNYAHHLEVGDVVVPNFDYKRRGLEKGQPYQIVAKKGDRLVLKDEWETYRNVDAAFQKAVYSASKLEIAVGERLRWTKNDNQQGRRNGQEFVIRAISGRVATIEYGDRKQEEIDFNLPQHLDYSYVSTTYSAQGKTAERVLIATDFTIAKESFYVAVSRVKSNLKVYTCDKQELLDLATISRANENPLELLRKKSIEVRSQKSFVRSHSSEVTEIETATQTIATATVEIPQPVKNKVDVEEKKIPTTPFPSAQTEQSITPENIEIEVAPNSIEPLLQPQNKPSNPPSQLKPRLEYLAWVNNATQLIRSSNPSKKDIDIGVAMLMMKRGKTTSEISLILSQSDVALSLQEHRGATSKAIDSSQNYINPVIETAANLRRELLQQKRRDLER